MPSLSLLFCWDEVCTIWTWACQNQTYFLQIVNYIIVLTLSHALVMSLMMSLMMPLMMPLMVPLMMPTLNWSWIHDTDIDAISLKLSANSTQTQLKLKPQTSNLKPQIQDKLKLKLKLDQKLFSGNINLTVCKICIKMLWMLILVPISFLWKSWPVQKQTYFTTFYEWVFYKYIFYNL